MAVLQDQGRVAVRERLDFPYAIDGHDHAPVYADEALRIEPAGETLQRLANEVRPAAGVQRQVVSLAFDPFDAGEIEVARTSACLDGNRLDGNGRRRGWPGGAETNSPHG